MSDESVETSGDDATDQPAGAAGGAPRPEKRLRRTMLSTGFSDVPGNTCKICGFQGFRWQTECPQGHPLG
jgi:hypothetical protein